jgi:hypothetical protein
MKRWITLLGAAILTMGIGAWAHQREGHQHHGKGCQGDCESCQKQGKRQGKRGRQGRNRQQAPETTQPAPLEKK